MSAASVMSDATPDDVIVAGGGPAGAVVAAQLAAWGHRVRLLTRLPDSGRALANSLPPSTRKLLGQVGILDLVERVGYPTTGNTVWWADRDGMVEPFAADGSAVGYQVPRAALDPLLLDRAAAAGATVEPAARVQQVRIDGDPPVVRYASGAASVERRARLVIDASGRSGVVAVPHRLRRHVPGGRMQALIGEWTRPDGWALDQPSHTFIETCDNGWAWALPVSAATRHLGAMVDGGTSRLDRGPDLESTYRGQVARTPRLAAQFEGAYLTNVFACDATVYDAVQYAGPGYLLVGDAGSTLNPLSSFGVKKALASAWLAAVAAHTMLCDATRAELAREFYNRWEAQVWQVNLRSSRDFAREALTTHATPFWQVQAAAPVDESRIAPGDHERLAAPPVRDAFNQLRSSGRLRFALQTACLTTAPVVRGQQVVSEEAVTLGPHPHDRLRYVRGVDLVGLARLSTRHTDVPAVLDAYVAQHGQTPLADVLGCLALLLAQQVIAAGRA